MKKIISILIVALTLNAKAQTVGFNFGALYSYVANQYGAQKELPPQLVRLINDNVPSIYLESARFSGTMSNYMNLHELGYGENAEQYNQWTMLQNRLNAKQKLDLVVLALRGDMKGVVNLFRPHVPQSYIINFVNSVKQLGIKNVEFTFNSHSPYRGHCTLEQSLASLRYVHQNTNLTHIELENETFLATYIVGNQNANEKASHNAMLPYYQYLENVVIPAIYTVVPKSVPIGLSVTNNANKKYVAYNKVVLDLARRLKSKGYDVYLAPHFYFKNDTDKQIGKEIDEIMAIYGRDFEYRITEFNLANGTKYDQSQVIGFVEKVRDIAGKKGIKAVYYHTIYTQRGVHLSFIK